MHTEIMAEEFFSGRQDARLLDIYEDREMLAYQRKRYGCAVKRFEEVYGAGEAALFSAPGRTELGGNHTDHQHGEVLTASVNLDIIGIVKKTPDRRIRLLSEGYEEIEVDLAELSCREEEKGTTAALIKGVAAGFTGRGYETGGFCAYVTSDVLAGAGLSSSAAFETLIGTIFSGLYNGGQVSPVEIALLGQYAENVYFGKPCGLMDQMACSVGNLVHIDFADPQKPEVEGLAFDMEAEGYRLCITDTKGSHADLTEEYAAIPGEMKQVAGYFGKEVLREVKPEEILREIQSIRNTCGDRSLLRALHFVCENERVKKEVKALKEGDVETFLQNVRASGDSSFKYLQNVYSNQDVKTQNVSVALQLSELLLENHGVCRVHGGGFAGTIQAFVKKEHAEEYKKGMDRVFGAGACTELRIRKYGGIRVI